MSVLADCPLVSAREPTLFASFYVRLQFNRSRPALHQIFCIGGRQLQSPARLWDEQNANDAVKCALPNRGFAGGGDAHGVARGLIH